MYLFARCRFRCSLSFQIRFSWCSACVHGLEKPLFPGTESIQSQLESWWHTVGLLLLGVLHYKLLFVYWSIQMLPLIVGIGISSPSLGFFLRVDWYAQSLCPSDLSASEVLIYSPGLLVKTWKKYQHGLCFSLRCYLRHLNTVSQPELPLCSGGNVECALQTTERKEQDDGVTSFLFCHISWRICHSLLFCGFLLSLTKRSFSIPVVCHEALCLSLAQMCWWIFNDCGPSQSFTYQCFNFLEE